MEMTIFRAYLCSITAKILLQTNNNNIMTNESQIDRLAQRLKELRPDITKGDRAAAILKYPMNKVTMSRYINGFTEKMNADKAVELIKFFEGRIAQREKAII